MAAFEKVILIDSDLSIIICELVQWEFLHKRSVLVVDLSCDLFNKREKNISHSKKLTNTPGEREEGQQLRVHSLAFTAQRSTKQPRRDLASCAKRRKRTRDWRARRIFPLCSLVALATRRDATRRNVANNPIDEDVSQPRMFLLVF